MRPELSRRRRRPRKRREPRPREWAVRSFSTGESTPELSGPSTYQAALALAVTKLLLGHEVKFGPYAELVADVPHLFAAGDLVVLADGSPARITRIRDHEGAPAYYVERLQPCGSGSCGDIWWLESSLRPAEEGRVPPRGVLR
jgi:hypothetical protein